jgi:hypothetical protein
MQHKQVSETDVLSVLDRPPSDLMTNKDFQMQRELQQLLCFMVSSFVSIKPQNYKHEAEKWKPGTLQDGDRQ